MGKEGNQAAAFADYAMPRFKDLRRALFWHGRPYALRLNNYVLWCLYKSVINATSKYVANFENGWSGDQPVDNLMMALYNVTFTVWFIVFQSVYDQDVSFSQYGNPDKVETSEKGLSFHMSDLYVYTRF
jgi:phospholipid-transporting ATPase